MKLSEYMSKYDFIDEVIAKAVGCCTSSIWKIRRGRCEPKLWMAVAIEDITHGQVTVRDLLLTDVIYLQEDPIVTAEKNRVSKIIQEKENEKNEGDRYRSLSDQS